MSIAERVLERMQTLPEPKAMEALRFVEFLATSKYPEATGPAPGEVSQWPEIILSFEGIPDLPPFEKDRDRLSAPKPDPLA